MQTLTCKPYTIELFAKEKCRGIIYAVMDQQGIKETRHLFEGHSLALAAISGSLWFDGFLDFMKNNTPTAKFTYLSLGDKEKLAKNPRLAEVEDCTSQAAELLGGRITSQWNLR